MKKTLLLPFLMGLVMVFAQNKTFTPEDASSPRFLPKKLADFHWLNTTGNYAYVPFTRDKLVAGGVTGSDNDLLTLDALKQQVPDVAGPFPMPKWIDDSSFYFKAGQGYYRYTLRTGKAELIHDLNFTPDAVEFSSTLGLALVSDHNILVASGPGMSFSQITSDGNDNLVYGEAVHRNEFGIEKGLFWSPDGNQLAFYRMDQSMVTDYPLVDFSEPTDEAGNKAMPSVKMTKYPFAGQKSHHVTIGIYDIRYQSTVYLKTGEPMDQYLTNISWSPDGNAIYVAVLNRDQNEMKLNRYHAGSGRFEATLFTETHPKYIEPLHGMQFFPGKPGEFLWYSNRSGFTHLYRYQTDGKLLGQVTTGRFEVEEILGFDEEAKNLFVSTRGLSPLDLNTYRVEIKTGKMTRLDFDPGIHTGIPNRNGSYLADTYSSFDTPYRAQVIDLAKNQAVKEVFAAPNPVEGYKMGHTRMLQLESEDYTPLYARMITPPDFDSTKTYPSIVYVYGGPHVQLVTNSWLNGGNLFFHYLAQQGYVVFTLDSRGSGNRGREFEQATFRQLGNVEMTDQLVGVNYLKYRSFIDTTRMGVHGWSFGGYMTTSLMVRTPGTFKVGVAGGPVMDWGRYEIMYTERYMDTPAQNPEGYAQTTLAQYAKDLQGHLLLIHGWQDNVVVPQHSTLFVNACIAAHKQVDYFPYPGHEHNVQGPDRGHLYGLIARYFAVHL